MKVLVVTPGVLPVPPVKGGAVETLVQQLVESLEKSSLDDVDLTVCSVDDSEIARNELRYRKTEYVFFNYGRIKRLISGGFGRLFLKVGISRAYFNLYLRAVSRLIKRERYDFVIVQNQPDFLLPIRRLTKAKVILHLHNDKLNIDSPLSKKIVQSCDGVITVSEYIKQRVETNPGIAPNNVKSLLNCVDVEHFSVCSDPRTSLDLRQKLDIEQFSKVILFVGRLDPTKGILELVKAFNALEQDGLSLLIVGSSWFGSNKADPFLATLKAEAAKSSNQVVFCGFVPHSEIPLFHQIADIVVVPSIWEDPCPLVVLEGMSSRKPVIATDSGGIPEILSKDCGIIVPRFEASSVFHVRLAGAMTGLLADDRQRAELGHQARERAEGFGVDGFALRFFQTLSQFDGN